jgi:4-amino-4-deoxy-L-arabinose transferase-like glycosyltransferase
MALDDSLVRGRSLVKIAAIWFAVALVALTPRLVRGRLRHWDEAWYAQVSREMIRRGDYLTPYWNGEPFFHKPPLGFWATAAAFQAFGENEISARLFSLLCGAGLVALVAAEIARRFGRSASVAAGASLLAIPEFARYATRGQLDVPTAFASAVQLFAFFRSLESDNDSNRTAEPSSESTTRRFSLARSFDRLSWIGGIAFGSAIMLKGAAAGVALFVEAASLALSGRFRTLFQFRFWIPIVIGVAIALPWHVALANKHGDQFINAYVDRHARQFYADIYPEDESPPPPVTFYLSFLTRNQSAWGLPYLALLGSAVVAAIGVRRTDVRGFFVWSIGVPIALSTARTKFGWYLTTTYAGSALLIGAATPTWIRFLAGSFGKRTRLIGLDASRFIVGLFIVVAAATTVEGMVAPVDREHEREIAELGAEIRRLIDENDVLHVLQSRAAKDSVYPIATLYYGERRVRPIHGLDDLSRVASGARHSFWLAACESQRSRIEELVVATSDQARLSPSPAAKSGEVLIFRVVRTELRNGDENP